MTILKTSGWEDYELLDSGDGKRLERFGRYVLVRPDPQAIWHQKLDQTEWHKADAVFENDRWIRKTAVLEQWLLTFEDLSFYAKLTPFKHTGIFPEQLLQWQWMVKQLTSSAIAKASADKQNSQNERLKILNLFGYTGIASLVCAKAGAAVTHVDASRPAIGWARENQAASRLVDKPIRWILDDALKFVKREIKRGVRYDGIIMDPPVYGHGPYNETWDFATSFPLLLESCRQVLSRQPVFIIINAYAVAASALMLENVLQDLSLELGGTVEAGELALEEKSGKRLLSTGIFGRWANS